MMKEKLKKYRHKFSAPKLKKKLGKYARQLGLKTVYTVLLLFFAYHRKETPTWAKSIILGTLGYFLAPFDAIPDLSPIIGYTDDLGVLSFGLVTVAAHVNQEVKTKARSKLKHWFGEYDPEDLAEVDKKL